ncbi:hypothetical protein KCP77_19240 [Salmonella enterica subsp. enterica]|nr:hypothetical protein KCP77_19240 [Salmonella enterica subsp. enterica]
MSCSFSVTRARFVARIAVITESSPRFLKPRRHALKPLPAAAAGVFTGKPPIAPSSPMRLPRTSKV